VISLSKKGQPEFDVIHGVKRPPDPVTETCDLFAGMFAIVY